VFHLKNNTASLQNHMKTLCQTIGARPTGSAKNKSAVDYAFGVLQNCGLQTYKQEFDWIDWRNYGATLTIDGQSVPAEPAEYSLPCDINAEFICLDTVAALQKAEVSNRIVVMHGDLCKETLMPKNFEFYNPEEHKLIIALLEEKAPKAIITAIPNRDHVIQDGDFNISCAVVSDKTMNAFLGNASRTAKLVINTERIPVKAHNVIATYGTGHDKVCFSAHIDTKPATPGALDNASGVSVLLTLAESLAGKEYPFQIEIVLLNGEDYYSIPGERAYMGGLTKEYRMAVNVDGVGLKESATSISFYECPENLENRIMEFVERTNGIERIEPWPMGDHMIFASFGIPTIAMTAGNIFNLIGSVTHSPDDDMKYIDLSVMDNVVRFLLNCVE
jgi:aminopeptidase YwaD